MSDNNNKLRFLEEHLKKNPDSILFARLADAYLKEEKVAEAIAVCEEGIKKHPYYVTGHLVLGKCYLANKLYDQAEKEFKRVLFFDPRYPAAHKYYGDLMQEIGWENTCESSYKKILQIDPLDEVARSRVMEFSAKHTPEPEPPVVEPAPAPAAPPAEIDFDAISPAAVDSVVDDDMIFKEPVVEEPLPPEPETEPQKVSAPEIDDQKIEEFSGILDDIFKDEVVKDDDAEETPADDLVSEFQRKPERFLDDYEMYRPEMERPQPAPPPPAPEQDSEDFEELDFTPRRVEPRESFTPPPRPEPKPPKSENTTFLTPKPKKGEKIVTPTLGEIYAAQGQYSKAIDVFEVLMKKYPNNEVFPQKIKLLKQKLAEQKNASKN